MFKNKPTEKDDQPSSSSSSSSSNNDNKNNSSKYDMDEIFKKCTNYKIRKSFCEKVTDKVKDLTSKK